MITLKKIDVYGQILIGIASLIGGIISLYINAPIIIYCFLIGWWQSVSAIVHLFVKKKNLCLAERKWYWAIAVFYLLLFWISVNYHFSTLTIPIFYLGLIPAIWYTKITYKELSVWEKRQLIQFK